ncbi:MAG TPA: hypothetical protein VD710_10350, partial [Nitrososphaeraceae archaeon]|nr:hypothetical protein [Nitrososphaeraceae archaeon]
GFKSLPAHYILIGIPLFEELIEFFHLTKYSKVLTKYGKFVRNNSTLLKNGSIEIQLLALESIK